MTLWGKKEEELPEKLKGLSPEDIVKALDEKDTLSAKINELSGTVSSKDEEFKQLKAQLNEVNQKLADTQAAQVRRDAKNNDDDEVSMWTDPQGFIRKETEQTRNIALNNGIMTCRMLLKQSLDSRDQRIYTKYSNEVENVVKQYQPEMQAQPQTWMASWTFVKGLHEKEISKAEREGSDFFSEGVSGGQPIGEKKEEKLTDEELAIVKKMGSTPERYAAQKKAMLVMK